jgi:hypothetical protein
VVTERHDVVALGLEGLCVALSHHAAAKQDGFHKKEQKKYETDWILSGICRQ